MRCLACDASFKGKDLTATDWHCPHCGHAVVADPRRHGVSDRAIARVLDKLTRQSTLHVLPEQVAYALTGRMQHPVRWLRARGLLTAAVLGSVLLAVTAGWVAAAVAAAAALALRVLLLRLLERRASPADALRLLQRFLAANPSPALLAGAAPPAGAGEPWRTLAHHAERVLVCDSRRLVDFLVANDFPLAHLCPVVGPDGYDAGRYPRLLDTLRDRETLTVLVLHALTPAGLAFARAVRSGPHWLVLPQAARIVDLGLTEEQRAALVDRAWPLADHAATVLVAGSSRRGAAAGTTAGAGVELAALAPAGLLGMLGWSVAHGAPLQLAAAQPEQSGVEAELDSE